MSTTVVPSRKRRDVNLAPNYIVLILLLGFALGPLLILLFIWRTANEDRTLQQELPGYRAYARQTRYRLVPGIW